MALYPEKFPLELIPLPQWCVYKLEDVDGKRTKVPYNPTTGYKASTTDPKTWAAYDVALAAYENIEGYNGVCFMLTKEAGIVFVDLDNCIIEGNIEPWAEEIVKQFNSYTERSQSGNGLHILIRGTKPGNKCRTAKYPHKVEIYDHARQCCLTGDVI